MQAEKKQKLVRMFKVIGFLLSVIVALSAVYFAAHPSSVPGALTTFRTYNANRIFAEDENTVDVVFCGHSGVYSGISPMEIYAEYGIAGYDYAQPLMMPWESYKCLDDLFKKQTPRLVVLDVDQFFYDSPMWLFKSYAKRAVLTVFPFYESHLQWRDGFGKPSRDANKGYVYKDGVKAYGGDTKFTQTEQAYEMHEKHAKYLKKICELCKARGVELALSELPSRYIWTYEKHNTIQRFADKYGLKFLDMNTDEITEAIMFDWASDTCDGGDHLNYSGAHKATRYMGRWLDGNFDLPDRRGDAAYAAWNSDLEKYREYISERVPNAFGKQSLNPKRGEICREK